MLPAFLGSLFAAQMGVEGTYIPDLYPASRATGGGTVMIFEELLDQAIALRQRRGRLTYRALKRQFDLDDDYLEDLKAELIQGQRLAVDEDGAVLVWTGSTEVSPRTTLPAPQPEAQPGTANAPRTPSLLAPDVPPSPDAERRQLTVLFCDLVGSTALGSA
jgi:hypothetical protein